MRGQVRVPLQLCVAVAICAALALQPNLRAILFCRGSWSGVTAVLVVEATAGATCRKGALRFLGTVTGCIVSVVIILSTSWIPTGGLREVATAVLITLWSGGIKLVQDIYGGTTAYGFVVANLTAALLVLGENPTPDWVLPAALQRVVSVSLGTIAALAAVMLVWPARSKDQTAAGLGDAVLGLHKLGMDTLPLFMGVPDPGGPGLNEVRLLAKQVRQALQQVEAAVPLMRWELPPRATFTASECQQVAAHLDRVLSVFLFLGDLLHCRCADDGFTHDTLDSAIEEFVACIEDLRLRIVKRGTTPPESRGVTAFHDAVEDFAVAVQKRHCTGMLAPALACGLRCIVQHFEEVYALLGVVVPTARSSGLLLSAHPDPDPKDECVAE